jgi:N-acetylglucosaminyldiphosphoundecaprenol N-acetyl-beta-D-mannosaminyltransferase
VSATIDRVVMVDARAHTTARGEASPTSDTVVVCGVRITNVSKEEAVVRMRQLVEAVPPRPHAVYIVNAHTVNLACDSAEYRALLNRGDYVFGDGTGIRWAARLQGVRMRDNLVGTDLIPLFFSRTRDAGHRYYLLGGKEETVAAAAAHVAQRYGVEVAGHHHGHFTPAENGSVVAAINAASPDVLLVAMGNPVQERWIHDNLPALRARLCVGIGGLVDHWGGTLTRAPAWVRRHGFEWAQIMLQQPHKWRRYVLGNPKFLWRVARQRRTDRHAGLP